MSQLRLRGCEGTRIIGLLVLVCNPGLLFATPLFVGNVPGTFVALWVLAVVLGLDSPKLGTVLSIVFIFVAVIATSAEYELTLRPETTG